MIIDVIAQSRCRALSPGVMIHENSRDSIDPPLGWVGEVDIVSRDLGRNEG